MQLAGSGVILRIRGMVSMRNPVNHQATHTADALAAVRVKGDRLFPAGK